MPIYNNPALGQAFDKIAQLFAPPSGSDLAGYAAAGAKNAEAARAAEAYAYARDPNFDREVFDRLLIANGGYAPTQSYYAQDQNNATTRRSQDISAATLRANNAADNARALATNSADNDRALVATAMEAATAPIAQGAIRPGFDPSAYGVASVPAVPEFSGRVAPLNEGEQKARERQSLIAGGQLTDQMLIDGIMGSETPVLVAGDDGKGRYSTPGAAVRTGAAPYTKPTGATETQNYRTADGKTGTAFFDTTTNSWKDTATQAPVPQGSVTFNSSLQGSASETGLAPTTANNTQSNNLEATLNAAEADAHNLLNLLARNSGIAGFPGDIRGAAQNAVSVLSEMSAAFGNLAPDAAITADKAKAALSSIAPNRDASIQQYKTGLANLAYRQAQMNNPSGEVSRQAYERSLESLQGGVLANNQSATEALNALLDQIARTRETQLKTLRAPGRPAPGSSADFVGAPAAPAAPVRPPEQAVNALRLNPTLAEQFDAKYGRGASAAILGAQ